MCCSNSDGEAYRARYADSIEDLIASRQEECARKREAFFDKYFVKRPDVIRSKMCELLGWPLTAERKPPLSVNTEKLGERDGVSICRVEFELFPGFRYFGILSVREDGKKRPFVIAQHGGSGTPELVTNLTDADTANYNHMVERVVARGVNVFAPQLLLWDPHVNKARPKDERFQSGGFRHELDGALRQVGSSITALELYCIRSAIDWFDAAPFTQSGRIGMIGLSYGGFYTLFASALDTRIKAAVSSCYFSERWKGLSIWSDWNWDGFAEYFMDAETALLSYPRCLTIQNGAQDELFLAERSINEEKRLRYLSEKYTSGSDWYTFELFGGKHELSKDDAAIDRMVSKL